MLNPANLRSVQNAASRVTLVQKVEPVARELYGTTELVLDEVATLRRVSLFLRGAGSYILTQDEKDAALDVIRNR